MCLGDGRGGQTRGQELSPLRCQVCASDLQIYDDNSVTLEKLSKELSAVTAKYHDEEESKIKSFQLFMRLYKSRCV